MFKRYCFPKEIILQVVYFKLRISLSYRDVAELLSIRGAGVDHVTKGGYISSFLYIEGTFRKRKKSVGKSWRTDETDNKVKGSGYIYIEQ